MCSYPDCSTVNSPIQLSDLNNIVGMACAMLTLYVPSLIYWTKNVKILNLIPYVLYGFIHSDIKLIGS